MPAVVLYLQAHQPHRLKWTSAFADADDWFDHDRNASILDRVATRCYRPTLGLLRDLASRHPGRFRFALAISGTLLTQWERHAVDLLHLVRDLTSDGACELLAETSHHSLASLAQGLAHEFESQVQGHVDRLESLFGVRPRIVRNTELIYSDAIAARLASMLGRDARPMFDAVIAEGIDTLLAGRSVAARFQAPRPIEPPAREPLECLLRDHALSDSIAFGFHNLAANASRPAQAFADRLAHHATGTHLIGLDIETFGEHLPSSLGVFDFLEDLPSAVARTTSLSGPIEFLTPSQAVARHRATNTPAVIWSAPTPTSWADASRDTSAWLGNPMQREAFALHADVGRELEAARRAADIAGDATLNGDLARLHSAWRDLSTSDHFYWMSTKVGDDARVHDYFRAYDSPYDAFLNYANVLRALRSRARASLPAQTRVAPHSALA